MYIERTNGWGMESLRLSELGGKEIVEINRAERLGVLGTNRFRN